MEFDDTVNRLLRHRRYLALVAIVAGLAAYFLASRAIVPTYRAQSRVLLGSAASSTQEAQVTVDRARAVATSQQVLTTAIAAAKVSRSPAQLAAETTILGLTDSGIATLSVTDHDPAAAAALCHALSDATVAFINKVNVTPVQNTLAALDAQLRQQIDSFAQAQAAVAPNSASGAAQLSVIAQDLNALSSARGQLIARQAQQVPAEVIDGPAAVGERMADDRALIAGLCVVGALLVWLLGAVLMESLRPTAPTVRSVARHFDAPLLGRLDAAMLEQDSASAQVIERLALSARRLRVSTLLVGGLVGGTADTVKAADRLMPRLEEAIRDCDASANPIAGTSNGSGERTSHSVTRGVALDVKTAATSTVSGAVSAPRNGQIGRTTAAVRVLPVSAAYLAPPSGVGVLVLARPGMRWTQLLGLEELLRCGRWPVVGVVQLA